MVYLDAPTNSAVNFEVQYFPPFNSCSTVSDLLMFVCLFVCGISLTSGQLINELFPDCTRSCILLVVLHRRGGDRDEVPICSSGTQCPLYSTASLG